MSSKCRFVNNRFRGAV